MKHIFFLAGAALLASGAPAYAKPGKAKHNKGHHARVIDRDGYYAPGLGACPPGLARKNNGCMPPGQAKKFALGQRLPYGYDRLMGYNALPYDLRSRYGSRLDPYSRYAYDDGYYYRVDPKTMVVQQILSAILR